MVDARLKLWLCTCNLRAPVRQFAAAARLRLDSTSSIHGLTRNVCPFVCAARIPAGCRAERGVVDVATAKLLAVSVSFTSFCVCDKIPNSTSSTIRGHRSKSVLTVYTDGRRSGSEAARQHCRSHRAQEGPAIHVQATIRLVPGRRVRLTILSGKHNVTTAGRSVPRLVASESGGRFPATQSREARSRARAGSRTGRSYRSSGITSAPLPPRTCARSCFAGLRGRGSGRLTRWPRPRN